MSFFEEMAWRGLVQQATEGLDELLAEEKMVAYVGALSRGDSLPTIKGPTSPIETAGQLRYDKRTPKRRFQF